MLASSFVQFQSHFSSTMASIYTLHHTRRTALFLGHSIQFVGNGHTHTLPHTSYWLPAELGYACIQKSRGLSHLGFFSSLWHFLQHTIWSHHTYCSHLLSAFCEKGNNMWLKKTIICVFCTFLYLWFVSDLTTNKPLWLSCDHVDVVQLHYHSFKHCRYILIYIEYHIKM